MATKRQSLMACVGRIVNRLHDSLRPWAAWDMSCAADLLIFIADWWHIQGNYVVGNQYTRKVLTVKCISVCEWMERIGGGSKLDMRTGPVRWLCVQFEDHGILALVGSAWQKVSTCLSRRGADSPVIVFRPPMSCISSTCLCVGRKKSS